MYKYSVIRTNGQDNVQMSITWNVDGLIEATGLKIAHLEVVTLVTQSGQILSQNNNNVIGEDNKIEEYKL